jgi:hypothetical protein
MRTEWVVEGFLLILLGIIILIKINIIFGISIIILGGFLSFLGILKRPMVMR